jgi:hypothetical protein
MLFSPESPALRLFAGGLPAGKEGEGAFFRQKQDGSQAANYVTIRTTGKDFI